MAQTLHQLITFDQFIDWYPENPQQKYELHDGVIITMSSPAGLHEEITGFLVRKLSVESDRLNLPYIFPKTAFIKPIENESAFSPDVLILNQPNLVNEPLWKKSSTVSQGASIPLVVEVVSTNWRDDYFIKLARYEEIGISEYWILDYAALGGRRFIGNPKLPTISLYWPVDGEYQLSLFRGSDRIISPTFPEFNLTVQQIFNAAEYW